MVLGFWPWSRVCPLLHGRQACKPATASPGLERALPYAWHDGGPAAVGPVVLRGSGAGRPAAARPGLCSGGELGASIALRAPACGAGSLSPPLCISASMISVSAWLWYCSRPDVLSVDCTFPHLQALRCAAAAPIASRVPKNCCTSVHLQAYTGSTAATQISRGLSPPQNSHMCQPYLVLLQHLWPQGCSALQQGARQSRGSWEPPCLGRRPASAAPTPGLLTGATRCPPQAAAAVKAGARAGSVVCRADGGAMQLRWVTSLPVGCRAGPNVTRHPAALPKG